MKQESDFRPESEFEVEENYDGSCDVILYDLDSIEEIIVEDDEGNEKTIYKYYAFRISLEYSEQVSDYIEENYETLLNDAKEHDRSIHAKAIREKRDRLLNESDWTQANDTALSQEMVEAYRVYRQALRDITGQEGFPYNVIWPEKPSN
jgi:hypothetical protein